MMDTALPIGCKVQVVLRDLLKINALLKVKMGFAGPIFTAYSALRACRGKRCLITITDSESKTQPAAGDQGRTG
ncbi:MAG: hypothetical protein CSA33_03545 [Desulfobulbus propionicus]|nr:MAG: hypothetical protein CSA33_03545 [Desulfobulbus propionicus]